jgi:hypothetical protein
MNTPYHLSLWRRGLIAFALLVAWTLPAAGQQFTPKNYCPSGLGAKYEIGDDGTIVYEDTNGGIGDIFDLTVTDTKSDGDILEVFWQFKIDDNATSNDYVVEAYIEKGGPDIQQETFSSASTSGRLASNDNRGISFFILCVGEDEVPCVAPSLTDRVLDSEFAEIRLTSADGIRRVEFRDALGGSEKLNNLEVDSFTGNLVEVTPGVDYAFDPNVYTSLSTEVVFTMRREDLSNPTASYMVAVANACGTVLFDPPVDFTVAERGKAFSLDGNAPNPSGTRRQLLSSLTRPQTWS